MRSIGFIATAIAAAAAVAVGATVAISLPDVKRYLNIRKM